MCITPMLAHKNKKATIQILARVVAKEANSYVLVHHWDNSGPGKKAFSKYLLTKTLKTEKSTFQIMYKPRVDL